MNFYYWQYFPVCRYLFQAKRMMPWLLTALWVGFRPYFIGLLHFRWNQYSCSSSFVTINQSFSAILLSNHPRLCPSQEIYLQSFFLFYWQSIVHLIDHNVKEIIFRIHLLDFSNNLALMFLWVSVSYKKLKFFHLLQKTCWKNCFLFS